MVFQMECKKMSTVLVDAGISAVDAAPDRPELDRAAAIREHAGLSLPADTEGARLLANVAEAKQSLADAQEQLKRHEKLRFVQAEKLDARRRELRSTLFASAPRAEIEE